MTKQHLHQTSNNNNRNSMLSDQLNAKQNNQNLKQRKISKIIMKSQTSSISFFDLKKKTRVIQPLAIYIIHLIIATIIAFQNIFIIYGYGFQSNYYKGANVIITILFIITFFSLLNSYLLLKQQSIKQTFKNIFLMYTLLDSILASQIAALIGLVGALMLAQLETVTQYFLIVMVPVSFHFFVGNLRVCLKFADWNTAQIIIYKISLIAGGVCFFQIGAYYMATSYLFTGGQSQQIDSKIKDFITLYAFGTFEFFRNMIQKISDFDQTSQFKYVYKFKKQQDDSTQTQSI